MRKPVGVSFEIGRDEKGWFAYIGKQKLLHIRPTRNDTNAKYGGFKFDLSFGKILGPIGKLWKWQYWSTDYMTEEPLTNQWNSGNHWFVLRIPFPIPTFFISICYGAGKNQPGFYVGFKTYEVNEISQALGKYTVGNPEVKLEKYPYPTTVAWGSVKDMGNVHLVPSFSLRGDLVDN